MYTKIITAIALATLLTSCSSLYKATSTPDDVYYSPAPVVKNADGTVAANDGSDIGYDRYDNYQTSTEDQYLRMKVQNNTLWSGIDDYAYWQDSRYDFGYSCNSSRFALMNSFYNPYGYGGWNSLNGYHGGFGYGYYGYGGGYGGWGSPYQTVVLYKNPKTYFGNGGNKSALTAYRNVQHSNSNYYKNSGYNNYNNPRNYNSYSTRNNTYNNNSNNNNNYQPARSFNNSSSSSSAGGHSGGYSSSGSSAPASRPTRH